MPGRAYIREGLYPGGPITAEDIMSNFRIYKS